jgi:hypothetical protein
MTKVSKIGNLSLTKHINRRMKMPRGRPKGSRNKSKITPKSTEQNMGETEEKDEIDEVLEGETQEEQEDEKKITVEDEGWTDYVLSQMYKNEKSQGLPRAHGLVSVCPRVGMGKIKSIESVVYEWPKENYYGATVKTKVVIERDCEEFVYEGSSHCDDNNTNKPYLNHVVAVAESKSLGKCMRIALGLSILSAEEMENEDNAMMDVGRSCLTTAQDMAINRLGERTNINVAQLIKDIFVQDIKSVDQLNSDDGCTLLKHLSSFQGDTEPPNNLKGYKSSWKQDLTNIDKNV